MSEKTLEQLKQEIEELQNEYQAMINHQRQSIISDLIRVIQEQNIKPEELFSKAQRSATKKKPGKSGDVKVYHSPDGQTWYEGKAGRRPQWFKDMLKAEGK